MLPTSDLHYCTAPDSSLAAYIAAVCNVLLSRCLEVSEVHTMPNGGQSGPREIVGQALVQAIDWAEENRRQLAIGALAAIAGAAWLTN